MEGGRWEEAVGPGRDSRFDSFPSKAEKSKLGLSVDATPRQLEPTVLESQVGLFEIPIVRV